MRSLTFVVLLVAIASCNAFSGVGDRLWRTFLVFSPIPLNSTDADAEGWAAEGGCDNNLGTQYTMDGSPIVVYYTAAGQIAGVGITTQDQPPQPLIGSYWKPYGSGYEVTVSFRNSSLMCSGDMSEDAIGDQLVINQDTVAQNIPLNVDSATAAQWTPGHCISKMGTHWAYDLATHPVLTHEVENLVPIIPMYNPETNDVSAFLVHINHIEKVEPFGIWEGPFIPSLFCYNFCDPCTWDATFISTMHFMLTDPDLNVCTTSCEGEGASFGFDPIF